MSKLDDEAKAFVAGALNEALDQTRYPHGEETISFRLAAARIMMECSYRAGYFAALENVVANDKGARR